MKRIFLFFCVLALITACQREESVSHKGNSPLHIDETTLKKGDIIQPFSYINPDDHDWKVEIRISGEDLHDIAHKRMRSRRFWTSEAEVLNKIREWKFKYGKGITHNATSTLRIYRDNVLIEKHGIVMEKKTFGFQSSKYGNLQPLDDEEMFRTIEEMNHF